MKKLCYSILPLLFFAMACTKKQSTVVPPPVSDTIYIDTTNKPLDSTILISGISDIKIESWSETTLNVQVSHVAGAVQKVSLSVSGLPERVEAEWDKEAGYTGFSTYLTIKTQFLKPDIYSITISSMTEAGKVRAYGINLIVDSIASSDCNSLFRNSVLTNTFEMTDKELDTVVRTPGVYIYHNLAKNELFLNNTFLSFGPDVTKQFGYAGTNGNEQIKIMFDCSTGMLVIPEQNVEGTRLSNGEQKMITISGSGNYDAVKGVVTLKYTSQYSEGTNTIIKTLQFDAEGLK